MIEALVASGYRVSLVCEILGFNRARYYRRKQNGMITEKVERKLACDVDCEHELINKIKEICKDHPYWGSRRVTNWLRKREGIVINRKRAQRIMREQDLILKAKKKPASRESNRRKPKPSRPYQWWGIDMTKFMVDRLGWIYLVAIVDWYSRKVVGYAVGRNCGSDIWIDALEQAVMSEFPEGCRDQDLFLMSDNGSQPTSRKFMNVTGLLGIQQAFTAYSNPKGNANTERWFRTAKEDCIWLHEWESYKKVKSDIKDYIEFYNNRYVHSALGGMSPNEFLRYEALKKAA
jgi:putative transposase